MKKKADKEMRDAIMDLVMKAQSGDVSHLRVVKKNNGGLAYRLGSIIGIAAFRITQVLFHPLFLVICGLALLYLLMHFTGLSLTVARHGEVFFTLR